MQFFQRNHLKYFDWLQLACTLVLCALGIVAIGSAVYSPTDDASAAFLRTLFDLRLVQWQSLWVGVGLIAIIGVLFFDYRVYGQWAAWFYWANIALLGAVLLMPAINGTTGWFTWGSGQDRTFQPSEIAKIAVILMMAKKLSQREKPIEKITELFSVLWYAALPVALIVLQNDMGNAMVIIFIAFGMLYLSGTNLKVLLGLTLFGGVALVPVSYLFLVNDSFRVNRIVDFFNQLLGIGEASQTQWQVEMSKMAIGSGQWFGKGFFQQGTLTTLDFVPANWTDFVFSAVGETMGFWGCLAVVAVFAVLLLRMLSVAYKTHDAFGSYIVMGVFCMMLFHIVENLGMNIGILPVTGIPLPFVSYGGSNMLTNLMCVGLVLNVGMRRQKPSMYL